MDSELQSQPQCVRQNICVKCPENGRVVLNGKDVYCRDCFIRHSTHRFRASFGKVKLFRDIDESVLMALSGGSSSSGALADLVIESYQLPTRRRLKVKPEILHIVECSIVGDKMEINGGLGLLEHFGDRFNIYTVHIASVFDDQSILRKVDSPDDFASVPGMCHATKLKALLDSVNNSTSRRELYYRLKTLLMVRCARALNIKYLFVGDSCTNLSSRLLSSVAQGRGRQVRDDVAMLDERWPAVQILRPLREFQNRDLAYYVQLRDLYRQRPFVYHRSTDHSAQRVSALDTVADEFVSELQIRFPATVSTLFGSATKLKPDPRDDHSSITTQRCVLCSSALENDEDNNGTVARKTCYGCSIIFEDIRDRSLLPAFLAS